LPAQRSGQSARTRAPTPPRVYMRRVAKLTRMRQNTDDPASRTLSFTFPRATGGGRRSAVEFVNVEDVPDFEGESAWFEMEKVQAGDGRTWPWWRAAHRVEPPADA
jgi:hypothetical protein